MIRVVRIECKALSGPRPIPNHCGQELQASFGRGICVSIGFVDSPNFLIYNTPDFLDSACHQNDTTDIDFDQI